MMQIKCDCYPKQQHFFCDCSFQTSSDAETMLPSLPPRFSLNPFKSDTKAKHVNARYVLLVCFKSLV